jgi:hypothetical protein
MISDTQAPPVQQGDYGHGDLINAVYKAIHRHPNPQQMAAYGKILASLLADQAKLHASGAAHQAAAGGAAPAGLAAHVAGGMLHDLPHYTGTPRYPTPPPGRFGIGGPQDAGGDQIGPQWALGPPPPGPIDDPILNAIHNIRPNLGGIASRLPTVGY